MLAQGAEGIQRLKDEADALGIVFDQDAADAAAEFTDSMNRVKQSAQGLQFAIGSALAPTITSVVDKVSGAVVRFQAWRKENQELADRIIKVTAVSGVLFAGLGAAMIALPRLIALVRSVGTAAVFMGRAFRAAHLSIVLLPAAVIAAGVALGWLISKVTGESEEFEKGIKVITDAIGRLVRDVTDKIGLGGAAADKALSDVEKAAASGAEDVGDVADAAERLQTAFEGLEVAGAAAGRGIALALEVPRGFLEPGFIQDMARIFRDVKGRLTDALDVGDLEAAEDAMQSIAFSAERAARAAEAQGMHGMAEMYRDAADNLQRLADEAHGAADAIEEVGEETEGTIVKITRLQEKLKLPDAVQGKLIEAQIRAFNDMARNRALLAQMVGSEEAARQVTAAKVQLGEALIVPQLPNPVAIGGAGGGSGGGSGGGNTLNVVINVPPGSDGEDVAEAFREMWGSTAWSAINEEQTRSS